MKWNNTTAALAIAMALAPQGAAATYTSRSIGIGEAAMDAVADPVTGKVFTSNQGRGRCFCGTISLVQPDGSVQTILDNVPAPGTLALSKTLRKLIVPHLGSDVVTVIDIDTLQATRMQSGWGGFAAVVSEEMGRAYVLGRNNNSMTPPWQNPGSLSGTITEVDLRSMSTRIVQVGFEPSRVSIDAAAGRVYIGGYQWLRTGEALPAFVQVFDATRGSLAGAAVQVGRSLQALIAAHDRQEVYLLGHAELVRPQYVNDPRYNSVIGALFVLDANSLSVKRKITLPDTKDVDRLGPGIIGDLYRDPQSGRLFAIDAMNQRLMVIDSDAGLLRVADTEQYPRGIGGDPANATVLVHMPEAGHAGVFSTQGERLDSVPLGRARVPGEVTLGFRFSTNPATQELIATNPHEGTLSVLAMREGHSMTTPLNLTDLWWNSAESGWGLYLEQQATTLFGGLFLEGADGKPAWYVMADGKRRGDGAFSGTLYRTRGPAGQALSSISVAGSLAVMPNADGSATLSYEAGDLKRTTTITRQAFGARRTCGWRVGASDRAPGGENFTSLWFDPAQPGWGLALSHQGEAMFGVLFAYDGENRASWDAMSNGERQSDGSYAGALYRVGSKAVSSVGAMSLSFKSANTATLTYQADAAQVTRSISRQLFAPLVSDCAS